MRALLSRTNGRHRLRWLGLGGIFVAALVFGAGSLVLGGSRVTAQEAGCDSEDVFCITKVTIPGNSNAVFQFAVTEEAEQDSVVQNETSEIISLHSGESFGGYIRGAVHVEELQTPGWELVDINCEHSEDVNLQPITGNGVTFSYFIGKPGSHINCTFVNRQQQRTPLNLGALIAGQPTPLPANRPVMSAPSAVASNAVAPVISPPNTGDAGLK